MHEQKNHYRLGFSAHGLILALIMNLMVGGCSAPNANDLLCTIPDFEELLGVEEIIANLTIDLARTDQPASQGTSIDLIITNNTEFNIAFQPGYGARLFLCGDVSGDWMEIPNAVQYIGEGEPLGSKPKGSTNYAALLTVAPSAPSSENFTIMRVAVVGETSDSTHPEPYRVGAFVDLPMGR